MKSVRKTVEECVPILDCADGDCEHCEREGRFRERVFGAVQQAREDGARWMHLRFTAELGRWLGRSMVKRFLDDVGDPADVRKEAP